MNGRVQSEGFCFRGLVHCIKSDFLGGDDGNCGLLEMISWQFMRDLNKAKAAAAIRQRHAQMQKGFFRTYRSHKGPIFVENKRDGP